MDALDPKIAEPPYPFQEHMGFEITAWERDFARVELPLAPYLMNRHGMVHGGVYGVLLDTAMGYAGCFTGDADRRQMAMTLSMTVNFLGRAAGTRLIAEGRRTGGGHKTFFAAARVTDDLGNAVAEGSGVFRYRGR